MNQLLLLRFSAMGDVALLAPVLHAFSQRYPTVQITVVTRPKFAVFFKQFANVHVVGADFDGQFKGVKGLIRLFAQLRRSTTFDLVIDEHQNLRSALLKRLFTIIGVPSVTIDKGRADKKALTRKTHKIRRALLHSVERYAQVFDRAGYTLMPTPSFYFEPVAEGLNEVTAFLAQQIIPAGVPWLGIAPFAQHPQKMWPFERMAPLLSQLYASVPVVVFLFGGGSQEVDQLTRLQEQFPQAILVAGRLSLTAELQLIRRLKGMLCMDSGNMHLAALSGVSILSIWGATHTDAGFGPWGQGDEAVLQIPVDQLTCRPCSVFGNKPCWRGDLACLNDISVDDVAKRVKAMLKPA